MKNSNNVCIIFSFFLLFTTTVYAQLNSSSLEKQNNSVASISDKLKNKAESLKQKASEVFSEKKKELIGSCPTGLPSVSITIVNQKNGVKITAFGDNVLAVSLIKQMVNTYLPNSSGRYEVKKLKYGNKIIAGVKTCFNADLSEAIVDYQLVAQGISGSITAEKNSDIEQIHKAASTWRKLKSANK